MQGPAKYLNSKYDYNYVREHQSDWKEYWQELYDSRMIWNNYSIDGEGVTDNTHRVIQSQDEEGNSIAIQQILEVDPNAKLFRIGFTEQEVLSELSN